ncbi:MAG TPA: membrane protein insertase YidC, partial [Aliiroseovarius sp.]|nr:membrane protein insertase YidC [Aliiroseovarius sp.]
MDDQNKNLILATVLSFLVISVWVYLFPPAVQDPELTAPNPAELSASGEITPPVAETGSPATAATTPAQVSTTAAALENAGRISIETEELTGSISLYGGRIDDLRLKKYRETIDDDSPIVTLFKPEGQDGAYYTLYGWAPAGDLGRDDVPGATTLWQAEGNSTLTAETPVTLVWNNGKGMTFRREISVDNEYMFTITQSVENASESAQRLAPYGVIRRHGLPADLSGFYILHEGAISQSGEEMEELSYKDMRKLDPNPVWGNASEVVSSTGNGWVGFTDHYWMTTIIPQSDQSFQEILKYYETSDLYTAWAQLDTMDVAAGASASATTRLFAGAKEYETIRNYEREGGVYKFIDSIDWGMFFIITKPMFAVLHWLNKMIGNMGWSI